MGKKWDQKADGVNRENIKRYIGTLRIHRGNGATGRRGAASREVRIKLSALRTHKKNYVQKANGHERGSGLLDCASKHAPPSVAGKETEPVQF